MKKLTKEEFILKSNIAHNNKYDYSLVEFKNLHSMVYIICPIHGIFEQEANSHVNGCECKKCGILKMAKSKTKTNEQFILESKQIHNNKYDYSLVQYKFNDENVIIICPEHGNFSQRPIDHLNGHGCSKCSKNYNYTTKEYIELANKIHKNKYDYSITKYLNKRTKIEIICPDHGIFTILPNNHIYGKKSGCSKCNESNGEKMIREFLEIKNIKYIKQKRFINCKYKNTLPFDFYLPEYNICIEFDGIQHFQPVNYWRGEEGFKEIQIKDKIKNKFCKENSINLIRIKYDENVVEKLENIAEKLSD